MRIGIFSDMHGNLAALEAILADMRAQGVDVILFAGDAFGELDKPVETVERMRGLPSLRMVRGNRERYMAGLEREEQRTWNTEQLAPLYWNYHMLGGARRAWLYGLEDLATYTFAGLPPVTMAHEGVQMLPSGATERIGGMQCIDWATPGGELPRGEVNRQVWAFLQADNGLVEDLRRLSPGVYICGHTHVQWHADFDGRILINPGSAGLPLDLVPGAPYTLLEGMDGAWRIEERRVAYDIDGALASLKASDAYAKSPIFFRIITAQLRDARLYWSPFLCLAEEIAIARGRAHWPVDNEVLYAAADVWFAEHTNM